MKLSPLLRFLRSSIYRRTAVFSGPFQHFEVVIPSSMCVRLCPWGIDLLLSFSTFCVSVPSNHRTRLIIDGPLPVLSYFGKCVFIPGHSCILAQFNTSRWPLSAAQTHVFSCEGHWYPQAHFNISMLPICAAVEQVSPSQGPQFSLVSYQHFEMTIKGGVGTCVNDNVFNSRHKHYPIPFQYFSVVIQCCFRTCQFIPGTLMGPCPLQLFWGDHSW